MLEAIVLAGGFGTRLRELVPDTPKPMALVAGRPFLDILLTALANKGFGRVILSLGYKAEEISDYFGQRFCGLELVYVVETDPLGTGGAVRLAMEQCTQDHVFIFNGDTYLDLEVDAVESQWQRTRRPIIVARQVSETERYGRLAIDGDLVVGFNEKGICGEGHINAGCYLFATGQLGEFALDQPFSLELDYLSRAVTKHKFGVHVTTGQFIDIGVPADYLRAQSELLGR